MRFDWIDPKIRPVLGWNITFDVANSIFAQLLIGGPVFILYLSELSLSKSQIGVALSLLPFAGILGMLLAPTITARHGFKRVFVVSWGLRKGVMALLLLAPFVYAQFGSAAAFAFVAGIIGVFAICRAIGETAYAPWTLEFIPNAIRGKYLAVISVTAYIGGFLALMLASRLIAGSTDVARFRPIIFVAVVFGFISVWAASFLPGGKTSEGPLRQAPAYADFLPALGDRHMRLFLAGAATMILATTALSTFLPLFMRDEVGLASDQVVLLQNATLVGALLSAFAWGSLADRYGSKPVTLLAVAVKMILPFFWLLLPRGAGISVYLAGAIFFVDGMASTGWGLGSGRLLYVNIVPAERKTAYLALQYGWYGLVGGISPLVAGFLLDRFQGLSGRFLFFNLDPYTFLFLAGIILPALSLALLKRIDAEGSVGVWQMARTVVGRRP